VPAETSQTLVAPFTGTVVATPAVADAHVTAGAPVVVIEAMKMEHAVVASMDGTLERIAVREGDQVERGAVVAEIAPRQSATLDR
jgi:biotin carboxyl carrier protein